MKIISIDTSGKFCSVSISLHNNIKESINSKRPLSHSSELAVNVKEILDKHDLEVNDLDYIAVNVGPGSFTGLRIGVSFAKGLSLSGDVPLVPINAFDVLKNIINSSEEVFYGCIYSHKNYAYGIKCKNGSISKPEIIDLNNNIDIPIYISGLDSDNLYDNNIIKVNFNSIHLIDFGKRYFTSNYEYDLNSINPVYIDYLSENEGN